MVFTTYREFLKNFKPSEPKNLFAEGGPAWNKYKKEHAAEIEKAPKKPLSKTRKKGKKSKGTKKIRGSRKVMRFLLKEGNFDNSAKEEIKSLLGKD